MKGGVLVSMTSARVRQIIDSLRNKAYRAALVDEGIDEHIPAQIRAMRQARGWSQKELAQRLGIPQHGVSRLENPNYGRFTLATLKRLAPVFDVALVVKYVPFSEYADWMANLSPDDLAVPDYEHDPGLAPSVSPSEATGQTDAQAVRSDSTEDVTLVIAHTPNLPSNRQANIRAPYLTVLPPVSTDQYGGYTGNRAAI